jgi:hypothetical protein
MTDWVSSFYEARGGQRLFDDVLLFLRFARRPSCRAGGALKNSLARKIDLPEAGGTSAQNLTTASNRAWMAFVRSSPLKCQIEPPVAAPLLMRNKLLGSGNDAISADVEVGLRIAFPNTQEVSE